MPPSHTEARPFIRVPAQITLPWDWPRAPALAGRRGSRPQRGAITLLAVLMLLVLLGFIGLALDLGRVYNRRMELQAVANGAALAAAAQLNGKADGVAAALAQAGAIAASMRTQYDMQQVGWYDAALSFGASPQGPWLGAGAAQAQPERLWFAQVDTARLTAPAGTLRLDLMRVLSPALTATPVAAQAVAGRTGLDVVPMAVCAMAATPAAPRANPGPPASVELVEYGFRRGVAYDLMQLNPHGTGAEQFAVAPHGLVTGGAGAAMLAVRPAALAPYVCAGELAMLRIGGEAVQVSRPFPLAALYRQFNARFNLYPGAACSYATAPPDRNIRAYYYDSGASWMTATSDEQGAQVVTANGKRQTVADLLPAPAATQARQYGPLWSYARAVPFSAYAAGVDEPAAGYTPFNPGDWPSLYAPGVPVAKNYPAGTATPYLATTGTHFTGPPAAEKGVANRRVLHVPLLACPVPAGALAQASVLAIGRFMMTVPATETSLYAEFGGVVAEHALGGPVELFR